MQKLFLPLVLCSVVIALCANAAFSDSKEPAGSSMLSRFKVGQRVWLERAMSGGYNVNILNDRYVKSYEDGDQKLTVPEIINVGGDFIVVDIGRGKRQAISILAIDVITHLPNADEVDSEKEVERF